MSALGSPARATLWDMRLGRIGVWRRHQPGPGIVGELEALGYGALWLGSSPSLAQAHGLLLDHLELHHRGLTGEDRRCRLRSAN